MKLIRILSVVRVAIVPLALAKLLMDRSSFPPGYEAAAWWLLAAQALVAAAPPRACVPLARTPAAARDAERRRRLRPRRRPAVRLHLGRPASRFARCLTWSCSRRRSSSACAAACSWRRCRCRSSRRWRCGATPSSATRREIDSIVLRGLIALALGGIVGRLVDMERGQARAAERAGRGGRAAPRRARATHRRARGHEPRRSRARLLARPRRGVRGVRPGAARPPAASTAPRSSSSRGAAAS